jgi:hypothetical protein
MRTTWSCSIDQVEQIRSILTHTLASCSQLWLSIDYPSSTSRVWSTFDQTIGHIDHVLFGALLSSDKFTRHRTWLDERTHHWSGRISTTRCLVLEQRTNRDNELVVRLSMPLKDVKIDVLVIDGDDFAELILSLSSLTIETQQDGSRPFQRYCRSTVN